MSVGVSVCVLFHSSTLFVLLQKKFIRVEQVGLILITKRQRAKSSEERQKECISNRGRLATDTILAPKFRGKMSTLTDSETPISVH